MTGRQVTVFGAGNIGRGLVGWLFGRAGWEVVFVDIFPELVDRLNSEGSYRVVEVGQGGRSTETIGRVSAVSGTDTARAVRATASADVVCTAVGVGALGKVAPVIAAALVQDRSRVGNVLACENADPNTALLRDQMSRGARPIPAGVGFPETMVDRLVPGSTGEGLTVEVESLFDFKIAEEGWVGGAPGVEGFELVPDLVLHRKKKLWLVNGLHAAAAFLGLRAGHDSIAEAVSDPAIRDHLEEVVQTMAGVLAAEFGHGSGAALVAYGRSNLDRFAGGALTDPVRRVARHPLRKLGPDERLVGPAREAARMAFPTGALCDAIAAGLSLDDSGVPGIDDLLDALAARGWQSVVGLDTADGPLLRMIEERLGR